LRKNLKQVTTYDTASTASSVAGGRQVSASGLKSELPYNVHLLALYTQDFLNFTQFSSPAPPRGAPSTSRVVVRLQHIFEEGESAKYATPVNVDLDALINLEGWKVANITETNLTANRAKVDVKKLMWRTGGSLTSDAAMGLQVRLWS
jgi:hypothetical protein